MKIALKLKNQIEEASKKLEILILKESGQKVHVNRNKAVKIHSGHNSSRNSS